MPQKPLDISTPLFYPRAQEQQASLPGEQPCDADAARIHKSVRVCSHMVHQSTRCKKLQRVFYCNLSKKVQSGAASGILEQGGGTQYRKERHSAAFLSPRALYFLRLRTVCYGITVHGLPTIFMAIPHNSKCRYGERGATAAKPKAQIILDVLSSIFGNADAVPQPPERCLSRKARIVRCCLYLWIIRTGYRTGRTGW